MKKEKVYYWWNEDGTEGITKDLEFAKQQENYEVASLDDLLFFQGIGQTLNGILEVNTGDLYLYYEDNEISDYIKLELAAVA